VVACVVKGSDLLVIFPVFTLAEDGTQSQPPSYDSSSESRTSEKDIKEDMEEVLTVAFFNKICLLGASTVSWHPPSSSTDCFKHTQSDPTSSG
jgi:hypothetical protein